MLQFDSMIFALQRCLIRKTRLQRSDARPWTSQIARSFAAGFVDYSSNACTVLHSTGLFQGSLGLQACEVGEAVREACREVAVKIVAPSCPKFGSVVSLDDYCQVVEAVEVQTGKQPLRPRESIFCADESLGNNSHHMPPLVA